MTSRVTKTSARKCATRRVLTMLLLMMTSTVAHVTCDRLSRDSVCDSTTDVMTSLSMMTMTSTVSYCSIASGCALIHSRTRFRTMTSTSFVYFRWRCCCCARQRDVASRRSSAGACFPVPTAATSICDCLALLLRRHTCPSSVWESNSPSSHCADSPPQP